MSSVNDEMESVERSNLSSFVMCLTWLSHFKTKIKTNDVSTHLPYLTTFEDRLFFLKLNVFTQTKEAQLISTNGGGNDITGTRQDEKDSMKHTLDKPVANTNLNKQHPNISHNHACMNKTNKYHR